MKTATTIFKEISLDEGIEFIHGRYGLNEQQKYQDVKLTINPFWYGAELKCVHCGKHADRFAILASNGGQNEENGIMVGAVLTPMCGHVPMNRDHIIPRALGGLDEDENLQASCINCNESKGSTVITNADLDRMMDTIHMLNAGEFIRRYRTALNKVKIAKKAKQKPAQQVAESYIKTFRQVVQALSARGVSIFDLVTVKEEA